MPWRIATGLSVSFWGVALLLAGHRLEYLSAYSGMLFDQYGWMVSAHVAAAMMALFALLYWLSRKTGLGDVGGKLKLMDKRLTAGEAHDAELGQRLTQERGGNVE